MSVNDPKVDAIVVSYNTKELTRKALLALFASEKNPSTVIVVDNASKDGSAEMIRNEFPGVKLIVKDENVGFARANNEAIRGSDADYVWLLNSDTETGRSTLLQLVNIMENDPGLGAAGPSLIYPGGEPQSPGGYFPTFLNVLGYLLPFGYILPEFIKNKMKRIALFPQALPETGMALDYVTGAACLLRRKALDECGLLGEQYFMYFEETDLCWRLKKKGWRVVAFKTDPVMHVYGGSFKAKTDQKRLRYFLESLEKFAKINYAPSRHIPIRILLKTLGPISIFIKTRRKI